MSAVPHSFAANALRAALPGALHGVWRGDTLAACAGARALASGHAALDRHLPDGGWPVGALSEILLPPHGRAEWSLVLPVLGAAVPRAADRLVLVAPPHDPFLPALQAAGVPAGRVCRIVPDPRGRAMAVPWACEQALRCRDVRAVLAWLPQSTPAVLRRLQLAAAQHQQLLWVFRPAQARTQASPAPLRLWVEHQGDTLAVHVLKRRGPPLAQPVVLPARGPLLAAVLQAQAQRRQQAQVAAWGMAAHTPQEVADALACLALATP